MATISDVAAYFCLHYPHKSELSKTRLTKLVYLADWLAAQKHGRQITSIKWYFHNYGPYVEDVFSTVTSDPRFKLIKTTNFYGDLKTQIAVDPSVESRLSLSVEEKGVLDSVIEETSPMYWDSFIEHVYSTMPIANSNRYSQLNLIEVAKAGS